MSEWETFEDPLYRLFDWPRRGSVENGIWYADLVRDRRRVYYAVESETRALIGRISLREIHGRVSSRLGIGFGTAYVGQGYGTESLSLFLGYYFGRLGFQRMVLDVAAINERAVRCYERCGFQHASSSYQPLPWNADTYFLDEESYQHLRRYIRHDGWRNLTLTYDMVLERQDWLAQQAELGREAGFLSAT
jgi:RimJ/RimL family protein N-acetyltransferase